MGECVFKRNAVLGETSKPREETPRIRSREQRKRGARRGGSRGVVCQCLSVCLSVCPCVCVVTAPRGGPYQARMTNQLRPRAGKPLYLDFTSYRTLSLVRFPSVCLFISPVRPSVGPSVQSFVCAFVCSFIGRRQPPGGAFKGDTVFHHHTHAPYICTPPHQYCTTLLYARYV